MSMGHQRDHPWFTGEDVFATSHPFRAAIWEGSTQKWFTIVTTSSLVAEMSTLLHHSRYHSWLGMARPLSNAGRPSRMLQMKGGIIDLLREASWPCPSFLGNKFLCLENTKCRKTSAYSLCTFPCLCSRYPPFLSFFPNHYPHRLEEPSWPANKQTGVWGHSHMTSTLAEGKHDWC